MPPLPHWDADGSQLRSNLDQLSARIEHDAARRVMPTLADAKQWHRQMMEGLAVDDVKMVGHFRGEPGLEKVDVHVDGVYGSAPALVAGEVNAFEAALRQRLAALDARHPLGRPLDEAGMTAAIELAAWVHAVWIRIHPFANGNGRTARLWANLILVRYGLPPAVAPRPRPGGDYAAAGAAALQHGQWRPTVDVFRKLVRDAVASQRATISARKPSKPA